MIDIKRKLKNFGPLEILVLSSLLYVAIMLTWTAITRSAVVQKANEIKTNHKLVVEFINEQVNECSSNENNKTSWGDDCNATWSSSKIVNYILNNIKLQVQNNNSLISIRTPYLTIAESNNLINKVEIIIDIQKYSNQKKIMRIR